MMILYRHNIDRIATLRVIFTYKSICSFIPTYERKDNYGIYAHWLNKSTSKISDIYLKWSRENKDISYGQAEGQTDICNYRVASLLR